MSIRNTLMAALAAMPLLAAAAAPHIVPRPASYEGTAGTFALPAKLTVQGPWADDAVAFLTMRGLEAATGHSPVVTVASDPAIAPEGYRLEVTPAGIAIAAADRSGVMYAVQTLSQIIDQAGDGAIDACLIADQPRMAYRGMMLDVVRCYLPIDEVKKMVDVLAQLKINTLHLHLTDDNGWRMQIDKYPRLTEVGAWRVDRPELFPGRANPKEGEPTTYGGYYTKDELRDLVAYAAERQIEVIPEIEMPAHAIAAIASYPELACPVDSGFVGVLPGIGGPAASIIMCAGNDNTLGFVTDVLDEVMEVFPSHYIHLGGDEANKSHWERCPKCQQRVADLGLDGFEALQGWFMDQINAYVRDHGREAIGWDEVTYGKPRQPMVIMGWQGDGSVAVDYARATGSRFIMTPALYTYLIRYQGPQWFEPFTYFGNITLRDAYEFDPVKPDWTPEMQDQLWGIQGSMWTEFCRTPADVQHQIFPRMLAISDAAWRQPGVNDWDDFVGATDVFVKRLDAAGINWARSMYNVQHAAVPNGDGTVTVSAECIRPDAAIAVATAPTMAGAETYAQPLVVAEPVDLYMQASVPSGAKGLTLALPVRFNKATGHAVSSDNCNNRLQHVITNGLRGSLRNSDFEWAGWHNRTADFVVDLGQTMPLDAISVGFLANANMNAGLPSQVRIYLAGDDGEFALAKTIDTAPGQRFPLIPGVTDLSAPLDAEARYVRIEADNAGPVPVGYPREGTLSWIYIDEVNIR